MNARQDENTCSTSFSTRAYVTVKYTFKNSKKTHQKLIHNFLAIYTSQFVPHFLWIAEMSISSDFFQIYSLVDFYLFTVSVLILYLFCQVLYYTITQSQLSPTFCGLLSTKLNNYLNFVVIWSKLLIEFGFNVYSHLQSNGIKFPLQLRNCEATQYGLSK